ncbi:MAG: AAA family ATPase [Bacilli bacterium]|nr:AAA family ATPase [Bacilli bacterium]
MKLQYLKINGFHNLSIEQKFSDSKIIGFIGNNGSGKSSVLESIMDSFFIAQHIDTIDPSYVFNIAYKMGENIYRFENERSAFFMYKNGKKDIKNLMSYMPKVIFTYYAGETTRLNQFAERYKEETKRYIDSIKNEMDVPEFKFATAFSLKDFKLAFLVHYLYDTACFKKVKKFLNFNEVGSRIILKLKKPSWAKNSQKNELWRAKGFQKVFYEKLIEVNEDYNSGAFARLDDDTREYKDEIWLGLLHEDLFRDMFATPLELFIQLKALVEVELLDEVYIEAKNTKDEYDISFFSEGEKQLANLLMLLDLTKDYEALYLLDEFDAYLHPNWQREFVKLVSNVEMNGQVFFTTHSPATISGLRKENVFIMYKGKIETLRKDVFNRSVDDIMRENMDFNLRDPKIDKMINQFKEKIFNREEQPALEILNKLKRILSKEDPFFITADIMLERFKL